MTATPVDFRGAHDHDVRTNVKVLRFSPRTGQVRNPGTDSYPSKQVICISGGNGEVRAPKALDYRRIYTNDLTVFVKQRAGGTAECRRGIMNDLVLKYAPYV